MTGVLWSDTFSSLKYVEEMFLNLSINNSILHISTNSLSKATIVQPTQWSELVVGLEIRA